MAINNKKLKNLFGTGTEQAPVQKEAVDIFSDDDIEQNVDYSYSDGVEELLPSPSIIKEKNTKPITEQNITDDINYILKTQCDLIAKSQQLVQVALQNAADDGTARDIEVAAGAINTASTSVEKLLALYEKMKKMSVNDTNTVQQTSNTYVQNQVIYHGTTSDILEQLENGTIDVNKL